MRFEDLEFVNYKDIIDSIDHLDSPSRATVAKKLMLSRTTVSNIVADLIDKEIVEETTTEDSGKPGRPGLRLRLRKGSWAALGASFDSSHWRFVKADLNGDIISIYDGKYIEPLTPDTLTNGLIEGIDHMLSDKTGKLLPGIGLGLPGIVDSNENRILLANDLKWHNPIDIGKIIKDRYGFSSYSVNRFTAAGIAEFRYANPDGEKNLIYIGVGQGIRSAIFIDGKLLRGASFSAGRIAHIVVDPDGPMCDCGKKGCLLTVANSDVLIEKANKLRASSCFKESRLNERQNLDVEYICFLADDGDECAKASIDSIVAPLSKGLGEICDIINPKKIIIGGPVGYSSKYLVSRLKENMEPKMNKDIPGSHIFIEQAKLKDFGSALGAASLVLEKKTDLLFPRNEASYS